MANTQAPGAARDAGAAAVVTRAPLPPEQGRSTRGTEAFPSCLCNGQMREPNGHVLFGISSRRQVLRNVLCFPKQRGVTVDALHDVSIIRKK